MSRNSRSATASSGNKKTSGYLSILEIREGENGDYISFTKNPNIEILINGVAVNGKSVYLNEPTSKYTRFVERGDMTQDEADEKIAKIPEYVVEEGVIKL